MHHAGWSLCLFCCMARLGLAATTLPPAQQRQQQQEPGKVPWLEPPGTTFPYMGQANDLHSLLKVQSTDSWVTVLIFTTSVRRAALNCIFSLVTHGLVSSYVVAALDEASLTDCLAWRLPCYNASLVYATLQSLEGTGASAAAQADNSSADEPHVHGTPLYNRVTFAKAAMAQAVLRLGYHVLMTDVDVVFFREVIRSYTHLFQWYHIDAVFMREDMLMSDNPDDPISSLHKYTLMNTGVFALQASNYSLRFVQEWLSLYGNNLGLNDQQALQTLAFRSYVTCSDRINCIVAKAAGWITVFRHPSQFGHTVCPNVNAMPTPCHPDRLFVHAVCANWAGGVKDHVFNMFSMWLVDDRGQPLWAEAPGSGNTTYRPHPYLPCRGIAWAKHARHGMRAEGMGMLDGPTPMV